VLPDYTACQPQAASSPPRCRAKKSGPARVTNLYALLTNTLLASSRKQRLLESGAVFSQSGDRELPGRVGYRPPGRKRPCREGLYQRRGLPPNLSSSCAPEIFTGAPGENMFTVMRRGQ